MNLIKSLMGRRQFLMAAGAASTLGLASRKLMRVFNLGSQTGVASASEKPDIAGMKGVFSNRYSHLLSPLKIGKVVLKNRMIQTISLPPFMQGPETFPSEQVISHFANVAKNGAAIVTCPYGGEVKSRKDLPKGAGHGRMWDIDDESVQNYFAQLTDAIHFYDSKASVSLRVTAPEGYNISAGIRGGMGRNSPGKEVSTEQIQKMIDDAASQAKFYQSLGFDMVNFHMSYRNTTLAESLSPALNKRTDQYGGSLENRARFALELFQAIKKACGQDFLIEAHISGEEEAGGYTIEDTVQYAKLWEGTLDILQLRGMDMDAAHPTGFNLRKGNPLTLRYAEAIKEGGARIITAPIGGFQDLDLNENYIASGKTDMIAMARAFICDPEYGKKAYEGRGEDVVPCLLCNDCHSFDKYKSWVSICAVNPKLGIAHRINRMIDPPGAPKKVAVIGGGPAGMKAAIIAAERGHKVTLYEKNDYLGGQLKHADFASFKWPLRDFKDYLIRQVKKAGVEVFLSTQATPEMIKAKEYDAIVVAVGAEPVIPDIPGADSSNVRAPIFVFGGEKALGKNIVVIGGDQIGTETGMYLAENGHAVTVLTREKSLATDANPVHFLATLRNVYEALKTFNYITEVTATGISEGKVIYVDATGNEKSIQADSVVIHAGRKPKHDEALKFYGAAARFFIIGDCHEEGNVRKSMRSAFAAASQI